MFNQSTYKKAYVYNFFQQLFSVSKAKRQLHPLKEVKASLQITTRPQKISMQ
ncbi:hypothetical protein [Lysinibacillus xylanilyticus]|uniref:Transposase n=1 Tax=Lysinibacillus xylanilyticus TaxID=582475 RepID=A0ABT4EU66_9BACI|nr:hypothetical protein [Lysinibacillus xylanilyticus]MCY9548031.1 hypothetical protein [Lysinibacillus xylanilyticus]